MSSQLVQSQSNAGTIDRIASQWSAHHMAGIDDGPLPHIANFTSEDAVPVHPDLSIWDIWPVQLDNGCVAQVDGTSLWVALSAPRSFNPDDRHNVARMRLFQLANGVWGDCGYLLPDGFAPGTREWSGSTRLDPATDRVTLWFTATGRRDTEAADFEQRLFQTVGMLDRSGSFPIVKDWRDLAPSAENDGTYYADLAVHQGIPGRIKGFRDPYWFRDPSSGCGYLLFTGSKPTAQSQSDYDGVIGIALADESDGLGTFSLLSAIIDADGLANELERPHMFVHDDLYYLFWSSQRSIFAPQGPSGPTGLYGMVGTSVFGPFEPLNGTGLVIANPADEPRQAYAWQVLPSLEVVSFVDFWGLNGRSIDEDPRLKAAQFGGTIAPMATIKLDGARSWIVEGGA